MKKKLAAIVVATMALSLAACGGNNASTAAPAESAAASTAAESTAAESTAAESTAAESTAEAASTIEFGDVMTYEEFDAAEIDTPVTVETYYNVRQLTGLF